MRAAPRGAASLPPLPITATQLADVQKSLHSAPVHQWQWIEVPHARCGNGQPTGFGFNRAQHSNELLIFMQGGGACSDAASCYERTLATYVASGYAAKQFAAEQSLLDSFLLTNRAFAHNPLKDAHLVYVPYCTGDVHSGNNVVQYPNAPQPTYHTGAIKTQLSAFVLAQGLPQVSRVVLAGSSAGGFGAVLNYGAIKALFGDRPVDVLSDSAANPLLPAALPSWGSMSPYGCDGCDPQHFDSFLPAYARAHPSARFAALAFATDTTLPRYLHMGVDVFSVALQDYFRQIDAVPNARTFLAPGRGHVVLNHPDIAAGPTSLGAFLQHMIDRDQPWLSVP